MSYSSKHVCNICGNDCGISHFKIKDNGWCCRKCFDKAGLNLSSPVASMSAETIKELIVTAKESSPHEEKSSYVEEMVKKPQNNKTRNIVLIITATIFLGVFLWLTIFVIADSPHNRNIEVLETFVGGALADDIVSALEKTASIKKDYSITSDDVTVCGNDAYEIFAEITVRVVIEGNHFKIYTFKQQYDIGTPILLFDSSNKRNFKTLTTKEYDSIRFSQRQHFVQTNIQITTKDIELYSIGSRIPVHAFEITIKNVSDKTIERVYFKWEDSIFYFSTNQYLDLENTGLPKTISPGETRKYTIDFINESDVISFLKIVFTDGTEIIFDEYDLQFFK